MAKKSQFVEDLQSSHVISSSLEYIFGNRFATYSKYVIQERALPDVRDGLKPVQRRILYCMNEDGNVATKPYRKSAKTVGAVIGNYHPHGDTSVYDAMVRMSQNWKNRLTLIDMHGNNGSIDNDPAAAMRNTEARLSSVCTYLLKDIKKNTVNFAPNYDDTTVEPTVLPARYPNLLVNGAKGIAAGYATDIPPHNLEEVIDATIFRMKNPKSTLLDLMNIMKGPDFPTGGIVEGIEGIKDAFRTGSGSVQIVSKHYIEEDKTCNRLVVTEIPYEVVKSKMVQEIDRIRFNKEIDGIIEVRDESGRNGLRVVVEISKEVDAQAVVNFLMKKTPLSVRYSYNMVSIIDKTPRLVGIVEMIDAYINHQIEVVTRLTQFDLDKAKARLHILSALKIAISCVDEVIKLIRSSKDKAESKRKIEERFGFDEVQSEAIVTLQLYRLSNFDIQEVINEIAELEKNVIEYNSILADNNKKKRVIIHDLNEFKKLYHCPRLTEVREEVSDFTIVNKPILKEDVMIALTRDGYCKRSSIKSYEATKKASDSDLPKCKSNDLFVALGLANTGDTILGFTSKGNFIYVPIYNLPDSKWKDEGVHINSILTLGHDEKIIKAYVIKDFNIKANIVLVSYFGNISRIPLENFVTQRWSKPIKAMKLADKDYLVNAEISDGDSSVTIINTIGKGYKFHETQIPIVKPGSKGVVALKNPTSSLIGGMVVSLHDTRDYYTVFTHQGGFRYHNTNQLELAKRASRCHDVFKSFISKEQHVLASMFKVKENDRLQVVYKNKETQIMLADDVHVSPLEKIMKNTLIDKGDELVVAAPIGLETITAKFKTYEPVDNSPVVAVYAKESETEIKAKQEELKQQEEFEEEGEQMSIFDDFF